MHSHHLTGYTKLRLWGLTQYKRVVYIDADALVMDSLDEVSRDKRCSDWRMEGARVEGVAAAVCLVESRPESHVATERFRDEAPSAIDSCSPCHNKIAGLQSL